MVTNVRRPVEHLTRHLDPHRLQILAQAAAVGAQAEARCVWQAHQTIGAGLQAGLGQAGSQVRGAGGVFQQVEALRGGEIVQHGGQRQVAPDGMVHELQPFCFRQPAHPVSDRDPATAVGVNAKARAAGLRCATGVGNV
jgi:hypothetical protein